ncbi:MAG: hypothetical protein JXA71_10100 [Chitinispirillaceae bacterium]|nr:hypothetical protein [Chitinispirillaceae bacterium]
MRAFFALLLLVSASAPAMTGVRGGSSLYVFYPSTMRPSIMAQKISGACPGIRVTVFGRYQDFKQRAESDNPDLIITKPPVLRELLRYSEIMRGVRQGEEKESCVLISIDKVIPYDSLPSIRIGVVDFLGRSGTERYMSDLLGRPLDLYRVIKIEDLLPMLTFSKAQAIFVGESTVPYFTKITYLNLVVTRLPGCKTGLAVCAVSDKREPAALENAVQVIKQNINKVLEIDKWKQLY